jgi:hypothetical protein
MPKFRKKPVVIEAVCCRDVILAEVESRTADLPDWLVDALTARAEQVSSVTVNREGCYVRTLEGTMHAKPDDWIIRGVKGELYPCKPDIFAATYDPEPAQVDVVLPAVDSVDYIIHRAAYGTPQTPFEKASRAMRVTPFGLECPKCGAVVAGRGLPDSHDEADFQRWKEQVAAHASCLEAR